MIMKIGKSVVYIGGVAEVWKLRNKVAGHSGHLKKVTSGIFDNFANLKFIHIGRRVLQKWRHSVKIRLNSWRITV